jgi:CAP-Gly domain-containing linker protein 1
VLETSDSADSFSTTSDDTQNGLQRDVCEICEQPGHDIFTCDVLKGDGPAPSLARRSMDPSVPYCEDCDSHGHLAVDCPHSMDVF